MPNLVGLAASKLSSTLSQAKSITSSVSTQASALLQKGRSLLPSAGVAGGAAVTGLIAGAGVAKFASSYSNQDFGKTPASDRTGKSPEDSTKEQFTTLRYPSDTPKYWMMLVFKEYKRPGALESKKDIPTLSVVFPMPTNLAEDFSVEYQSAALGAVVGGVEEMVNRLMSGERTGLAQMSESEAKGIFATIGRHAVTEAMEEGGLGSLGEKTGAAFDKTLGVVANPHLAVIFQQANLREHTFSYRFSPNNEGELRTLRTIIKSIKKRILPTPDAAAFTMRFPNTCDIIFGGGPNTNELYKIKTSVMSDFKINYAPQGSPAFFRTGDPVEVEISMSFKEMEVHTSDDY